MDEQRRRPRRSATLGRMDDLHAETDRTFGGCGDPACPTGALAEPEHTNQRGENVAPLRSNGAAGRHQIPDSADTRPGAD